MTHPYYHAYKVRESASKMLADIQKAAAVNDGTYTWAPSPAQGAAVEIVRVLYESSFLREALDSYWRFDAAP